MRLLRTQSGEGQVWRVSLEDPLTEQVHRFNDLNGLFAFLLACTSQASNGAEGSGDTGCEA
jgi:hypothetical protein